MHCALIFEYVNTELLLTKINNALNDNGMMTVLLQLPHKSSPAVSESNFSSLQSLEGYIKPLQPEEFKEEAVSNGFRCSSENIFTLKSGKTFWFGTFGKM